MRMSLAIFVLLIGSSTPLLAQVGAPTPPGNAAPSTYAPPPGYPAAYAPPPQTGFHAHEGGYLRLQLGGGFTTMSASSAGSDVEVSGGGAALVLAVGGAVSPNLVVYGAIMDSVSSNPDVKLNGTKVGTGTGQSSAGVVGFGPGFAYYLDPGNLNMFVSGTLLFSKLVINGSDGSKIGESDFGVTGELQFGKEWWVSDNWGLGLTAQLMLGRMKDKDAGLGTTPPTWTVKAFSLLFSATYN